MSCSITFRSEGRGSTGRALSSVDLIEALYFGTENGRQIFKHDSRMPQWEDRDYFVLSKIEALPALYSVLKMRGFNLGENPPDLPNRKTPGIEVTSDRHAYGISVAVGMARLSKWTSGIVMFFASLQIMNSITARLGRRL